MKTYPMIIWVSISLFIGGCNVEAQKEEQSALTSREQTALQAGREIALQEGKRWIGEKEAIAAANREFLKTRDSLAGFNAVACETVELWEVIYEGEGQGIQEYWISKTSGKVLTGERVPLSLPEQHKNKSVSEKGKGSGIGRRDAIEVATRHFREFVMFHGGTGEEVEKYNAFVCELKNVWRVVFEFRQQRAFETLPNTNPPSYIIDKKTGEIIYTTHRIDQ